MIDEWLLKAKIGTETSGLWPHKTGACLIEVHLHVKSIGGKRNCLFKTGACLIQGLPKTGWTVYNWSGKVGEHVGLAG